MSDGHYRSIKPLKWCSCATAHAYLFTDTRASINTHHPESQRFRELLTLLCDLQSQLSGWSHNYSCVKGRKNRIIGLLSLGKTVGLHLTYSWVLNPDYEKQRNQTGFIWFYLNVIKRWVYLYVSEKPKGRIKVPVAYRLGPLIPPGVSGPWCVGTWAAGKLWFSHCRS